MFLFSLSLSNCAKGYRLHSSILWLTGHFSPVVLISIPRNVSANHYWPETDRKTSEFQYEYSTFPQQSQLITSLQPLGKLWILFLKLYTGTFWCTTPPRCFINNHSNTFHTGLILQVWSLWKKNSVELLRSHLIFKMKQKTEDCTHSHKLSLLTSPRPQGEEDEGRCGSIHMQTQCESLFPIRLSLIFVWMFYPLVAGF